jgi:hypothetical protein
VLKKSDVGSGGLFSRESQKIAVSDINGLAQLPAQGIRSESLEIALGGVFQHYRPIADIARASGRAMLAKPLDARFSSGPLPQSISSTRDP